jgi:hypothetical protein
MAKKPDPEWAKAIDYLKGLRNHPAPDGESEPVPADIIDAAAHLAYGLSYHDYLPPQRVLAGVNGTIYFEWHGGGTCIYQEIEIDHPESWRGYKLKLGGESQHISGKLPRVCTCGVKHG